MLKRGHRTVSHHVRNLAECALDFSSKIRAAAQFPSEETMRAALDQLDRHRIIAAIGDHGAGKSSVLDLLCGTSFIASSGDPALGRLWASSPRACDNRLPEGLEIKYYPADLLNGLALLDTAGLDKLDNPVRLLKTLAHADLYIVVLDARNPGSSDTWQYLTQLPAGAHNRIIVAITHEDLFDYSSQQQIKHLVRQQSQLHLGVELPLYMIRAGGQNKGQGAEALARRINSMLDTLALHSGDEQQLIDITRTLLGEQKQVLGNQDRLSRLDAGFLTNIEYEIDHVHSRISDVIPARLQAISDFVQNCVGMLARKSTRQLGYHLSIRNLSRLPRLSLYIDNWYYEYLRKGIEEQQEHHNREFLAACEQHWNSVRPRVRDQLDCEIGEFPAEHMRAKLDGYRRALGRALYKPLVDFGLKPCLTKFYAGQTGWMKLLLTLILALVILAGILGGLGETLVGIILITCALFFWLISSAAILFIRWRMTGQIAAAAADMHLAIQSGLKNPLYQTTLSGVTDYRELYTNIRGQVAVNAGQLAPLMAEHDKLFYQLSALTRHL